MLAALIVVAVLAVACLILAAATVAITRLLGVALLGPFTTTATTPGILGLPSIATIILGLVDGALTILTHNNFGLSVPLAAALSTGLVLLGGLGVQPLLGPAFETALHFSFRVTAGISALMSALTYWVGTNPIGLSHTAAGWITGVIAFLTLAGFGTTVASVAKAAGMKTSAR